MSLETLIQRFQTKDERAFEKLYEMYSENIFGVVFSIVRDEGLAAELCQDVFLKAWNNADSYNVSKGRFFTWILSIARNTAVDQLRSRSFQNTKRNFSANYLVNTLPAEEEKDGAIEKKQLKKLIGNLKSKCIEIIEFLYFKGYSQKETAEELDIPLGTVKTRNRNCIGQLRKNIKL